jgi:oxygen-dependent protoporphyrinogen oxidase
MVFEQAAAPGGAIRSLFVAGRVLEAGPQRVRLTPAIKRLVTELGLENELLVASADLPLWIYKASHLRRAPLSLTGLMRTNLLDVGARLRLLLEPFRMRAHDDETVADYLSRRFGRAVYTDLLGPLFGGLYASDPADMLVRHALAPLLRDLGIERSPVIVRLARRRTPAPAASFRAGLQTLILAMHKRVQQHVQLDARVHAVRLAQSGFVLATSAGDVDVDRVVYTTPAAVTATLLPDSARAAAERLRGLTYNRLVIVYLISAAPLIGLGFQTSFAERIETRGVTFNGAMLGEGREGLFTAFLGGARSPTLADATDQTASEIAAREFALVTGHAARPIHVARAQIPAWDRTWTALDGLTLPSGIHLCANYESRVGIGGRLLRAERLAGQLVGGTTHV